MIVDDAVTDDYHKTYIATTHPVAFGEHRIMLRPRDGHDLRVLSAASRSSRSRCSLRWIMTCRQQRRDRDAFDERGQNAVVHFHGDDRSIIRLKSSADRG